MLSIQSTILLLVQLLFITSSNAFVSSPSSHCISLLSSPSSFSTSALNVGMSYDEEADAYFQLLQRANDCAKDEECSLEEWESVMTEMEYISDMEAEELSHLVEGIHRLEERSALSPWTDSKNLPIAVLMFLASTMSTLNAQNDEIVTRVGWFFQDWSQVATSATTTTTTNQLPLFVCAAAAYVAVSEVVSCFLPSEAQE